MKKQRNILICLSVENWKRVVNSIDNSNYCIVKNFNGKQIRSYSKAAKDLKGFRANKYLSRKIKSKLNKE